MPPQGPKKGRARAVAIGLIALILILILIGGSSCREPTNVLIETYTDVPYQSGRTVSYFAGKPGTTEFKLKADAILDQPWSTSSIGTLTVVPEGEDEEVIVTVKLVMGVGRTTSECFPPSYQGCIVARRRIRYVPHERLKLPISLYANCVDVPCDADTTCNVLGKCVSSIPSCASDTCAIEGESASTPPVVVGGGPPPEGGAPTDGPNTQADANADGSSDGSSSDGAIDGGDGGSASSVGFIRCPGANLENRCAINAQPSQHCCFDGTQQTGACAPGGLCPSGGGVETVFCDGPEDCSNTATPFCCDQGNIYVCSASCATISSVICEGSDVCPSMARCLPSSTFYKRCFPN
jgi:hypothetical protein